MALAPGTHIGPYEVIAPLGAGGMGEVHRARDHRLSREVAIKMLPAALAGDEERRQRFEREARAASGLNHPAIVTIHDVGVHEGQPFIAMELVEGRTLRELLAGALPLRKALDLAVQVAEGLARAHEAGIVHRDLKPENVVVSREGHVKLLDFGLAKLRDDLADAGAPETATRTRLPSLQTGSGVVMGTVGYMAPEQAAGRPADFRADQFALGLILYEMLTARRAFQRDTSVETLAAVLREEPEPIERLAPGVPAPVRWLVERCLAKDPEDRYSSTRDLARELRSLRDHLSEASVVGMPAPGPAPRTMPRRQALAIAAAASSLAGTAGVLVGRRLAARPSPAFRRLTFRRGHVRSARIAGDGHTVIYSAAWEGGPAELFATRTDSTESRPLGVSGADVLAISGQGEMALSLERRAVLGFESTGTLARMPLSGGAPRRVLDGIFDADWAPDGRTLAVVRDSGPARRLELPPGHVLFETGGSLSSPRVAPDGERVAVLHHPIRGDNAGAVLLLEAGRATEISGPWASLTGLNWARAGRELWFAGAEHGNYAELYAVEPQRRAQRRVVALPGRVLLFDIGTEGRVLLNRQSWSREIAGRGPGDLAERSLSWLDWSFLADLSIDGRTLLIVEQGEGAGANYVMYLRPSDGGAALRLGEGRGLALSRDGAWVLAAPQPRDTGPLQLVPTGAGPPRPLAGPPLVVQSGAFMPDGRAVVFSAAELGSPTRVYEQLLDGPPRAVSEPGFVINSSAAISPDATRVVALGPDRGLWLLPLRGGAPAPVAGRSEGDQLVGWTAGGALYVAAADRLPARVETLDPVSGVRRLWRELKPADPGGVPGLFPIRITLDGSAYAYSYRRMLGDLYAVDGLG